MVSKKSGRLVVHNLAIIPVRMGSKRLKNKNILDFFGRPLFVHTIDAALKSGLFDEIHVSTESELIVDICMENNLPVHFLRDESLANDAANLESVCSYVLNTFIDKYNKSFDNFCLLWATAPLRTSLDIIKSYELLTGEPDGVVSVTNYDLPVFCAQQKNMDGFLTPNFPDMFCLPSQKMPEVCCDNGALFWMRVQAFRNEGLWMSKKTRPYYMEKERSVDIDTQDDLNLAKYYYSKILDDE